MARATTSVSASRATSVNDMRKLAWYCAFLLLAVTVHAAEADAEADDGAATGSTEENTPADLDAAVNEEIRAAEAAAATPQRGTTDEPFVPSVQISEDLSVSFPVDI